MNYAQTVTNNRTYDATLRNPGSRPAYTTLHSLYDLVTFLDCCHIQANA